MVDCPYSTEQGFITNGGNMLQNSEAGKKGQKKGYDVQLNVTMTRAMKAEIERMAVREDMPMAQLARKLMLAGLGQMGGSWRVEGGGL